MRPVIMPTAFRLLDLPPSARVALAGFVVLLAGLHLTAQATLWITAGDGCLPGPDDVLAKYHGSPDRTLLHDVLDLARPQGDSRAMYWFLDATATPDDLARVRARRAQVLAWAEAGAPEAAWPEIRAVLHDQAMCMQCHGFGGERYALTPLETYEEVRAVARPGQGMPLGVLLTSAHNHVFGFGALALLLALATAFTSLPRFWKVLLAVLAFGGAALDVGGWFLTRAWGGPFPYVVILGGAAFGAATTLMGLAVLDEVVLRGRVARRIHGLPPPVSTPRAAGRTP